MKPELRLPRLTLLAAGLAATLAASAWAQPTSLAPTPVPVPSPAVQIDGGAPVSSMVQFFQRQVPPTPPPAPAPPSAPRVAAPIPPRFDAPRAGDLASLWYEQARNSIESGRYARAVEQLKQLIDKFESQQNPTANRVDAAYYWKAYSELKLDAMRDALATVQKMMTQFDDSRWLKDAKALEIEIRQATGQNVSPDAQADEDIKLLALRGLMWTDPDRAIPRVEQLLNGNASLRVKENALFVLSQSRTPKAIDIITATAKSSSNPELQARAVRYLATMTAAENSQTLEDIYRSSSDEMVKRVVIQELGSRRRVGTLVALARTEKDPQLKKEIVSYLSRMKSKEVADYMLELLK